MCRAVDKRGKPVLAELTECRSITSTRPKLSGTAVVAIPTILAGADLSTVTGITSRREREKAPPGLERVEMVLTRGTRSAATRRLETWMLALGPDAPR